jgi:molybdopterin-biosynthesis enzyme MoeA-like protein
VPESELAAAISNIREQHKEIYFKTHPHSSRNKEGNIEVEIHLTTIGKEQQEKEMQIAKEELITLIKQLKGANGQEPKIIVSSNSNSK